MRQSLAISCLATTMLTIVAPSASAATISTRMLAERHNFTIPAQPLNTSLRDLSVQAGVRILYPYDAVVRYRAREVRGVLSIREALSQLMDGTSLHLTMADGGVITIAGANRGAARAVRGQSVGAAGTASAAAAPEPATTSAAVPQDDIIVTGTRASDRTVTQSLAPIDVLGKGDLQASGKQSVRDLLGTLVPSISVSNSGAGASFAVKTLSLRGLSGDQLLVLVNGKRRHNTATMFINGTTQNGQSPPDLDLIPATAIERIEVLRDGASAQYGSDAIAGVVNIILKNDHSIGGSALFGANADGGGQTGRVQADLGLGLGDGGHFHVAIDGYMQGRTMRGTANTSQFYFPINGQPDPREATVNRYVNKPGQPQVVGVNFSYDAALPLGGAEFYSTGTASSRHADAWLTFRNPNASNNIIDVHPEGYIPRLNVYDRDYQIVGGIRGDGLAGFHYDLSTSYALNRVSYRENTALNASLGPASPTSFYIGAVKATEWTSNLDLSRNLDLGLAKPLFVAFGTEYRENNYRIEAGELASYVDGGFRSPAGQPFAGVARQAGSQGVTGFPPSAAGTHGRHNWSAYINLEQKLFEGVDVALAGRHEDYSDFGTTNIGKASIRIEPIHGIAFRGTVSTGFRAPTLQQEFYASSSTIGVLLPGATVTTLAPVRALPVNDPVAIALGATPLKAEKSTNYSAGMVLTPFRGFNLTVDAYQITIRDRILLSGTLTGAASAGGALNGVATILKNAGLNPFQSGFYFSNAADTRTRGLDVVGTYKTGLGSLGKATMSLSANFNDTKFTRLEVPAVLAAVGATLIDRARQGDFTKGTPHNKFIANIFWTLDAFSLNARATRYGKVVQVSTNPALDDPINPRVIADLELGYRLQQGIKFSVGANNLFNTYPNILLPGNQGTSGFAYYNAYSPYGISGGFYYGKISVNL